VQFDTAVNMGPGRAVRFLQSALGCGVDGDFGPATERAMAAADIGDAIAKYCNTREAYYRGLVNKNPKLGVFLKGWLNRLNALRREVGLPGFESDAAFDLGDADHIARIPDVGENPDYDL
jgi:lysozyme family protein